MYDVFFCKVYTGSFGLIGSLYFNEIFEPVLATQATECFLLLNNTICE